MKIRIDVNGGEAFPIYELYNLDPNSPYADIEVDVETLKRWQKAFETFSAVQQEIVDQMKSQGKEKFIWYRSDLSWNGFHLEEK